MLSSAAVRIISAAVGNMSLGISTNFNSIDIICVISTTEIVIKSKSTGELAAEIAVMYAGQVDKPGNVYMAADME